MTPSETAKARGANQDARFGKLDLFYPVLMSCTLDRSNAPEGTEPDKIERFLETTIRRIDATPHIGVCRFSAGQKFKDTKILEIQAIYYVAFRYDDGNISEKDKRHLLKELAASAAWPLFRDLFIHVGSQSGEELPLLPNLPKLEWLE